MSKLQSQTLASKCRTYVITRSRPHQVLYKTKTITLYAVSVQTYRFMQILHKHTHTYFILCAPWFIQQACVFWWPAKRASWPACSLNLQLPERIWAHWVNSYIQVVYSICIQYWYINVRMCQSVSKYTQGKAIGVFCKKLYMSTIRRVTRINK